MAGLPGHYIEDVTIDNVTMVTKGGGTKEDAETILPEFNLETLQGWWPGILSASKLYQSVSICGPSATAKPISAKIAVTSSVT